MYVLFLAMSGSIIFTVQCGLFLASYILQCHLLVGNTSYFWQRRLCSSVLPCTRSYFWQCQLLLCNMNYSSGQNKVPTAELKSRLIVVQKSFDSRLIVVV